MKYLPLTMHHITHREDTEPVREWLREHGIDPHTVPVPTTVVIRDGSLIVERLATDAEGKFIPDDLRDDAKRETVEVPLVAPWPIGAHS